VDGAGHRTRAVEHEHDVEAALLQLRDGLPERARADAAVDAGNAASLLSGLPISVVDLDRCRGPLAVDVPAAGTRFVFNQSGQEIDVGGLLCLFDAEGPCANAVREAQRTKTNAQSRRGLGVGWGVAAAGPGHAERTAAWLGELLTRLGASVSSALVEQV
jgi:DNA/RNA-binding domain of Phe-tRNA-synthetase-like protein